MSWVSPPLPARGAAPPATRAGRAVRAVPWALAAATVAAQIAYPLVAGDARSALTAGTVVLFAAASVAHAWASRGAAWAAGFVALAGGTGLCAEAVGVATGVPFGAYAYTGSLGPEVRGVPLVIPLAWVMMAYPALVAGRRLAGGAARGPVGRRRLLAWPLGALALASWDLFLDPQMVAAGHWRWADPTPALPGVPGVPLSNYAGWALVALVLMGLLHAALPDRPADDALPATLYLWTYGSSVLASAVFFGRPAVAVVGGIGMGLVAVPYAATLWRSRR